MALLNITSYTEGNAALVGKLPAGQFIEGKSIVKIALSGPATNGGYPVVRAVVTFYMEDGASARQYTDTPVVSGATATCTISCQLPQEYAGYRRFDCWYTYSNGKYASYASSDSVYVTIHDYVVPALWDFTVFRANSAGVRDDNGTYAGFSFGAYISPVNNINTRAARILYRQVGTTAWTTHTLSLTSYETVSLKGTIPSGAFNAAFSYELMLEVQDMWNTSSSTKTLPPGSVLFHMKGNGKGVAFGTYATKDGELDINLTTRFRQSVSFDNPAAALRAIGVIYAVTLPYTGVEGQLCLVPV